MTDPFHVLKVASFVCLGVAVAAALVAAATYLTPPNRVEDLTPEPSSLPVPVTR